MTKCSALLNFREAAVRGARTASSSAEENVPQFVFVGTPGIERRDASRGDDAAGECAEQAIAHFGLVKRIENGGAEEDACDTKRCVLIGDDLDRTVLLLVKLSLRPMSSAA
jgi:hypothetical protein